MDRKTKFKVSVITIIGVIVTYLYIYRGELTSDFKNAQREKEWGTEEPQGRLIDGRKDGEWKVYYKNGELARIENYEDDTLHGKNITYWPSGRYHSRCTYFKGTLVDSFFTYHSNGNLNSAEFFDKNGKHQGGFNIYYENGQVRQTGHMIDGILDGQIKEFYVSGRLKEVYFYKQREKAGKWIWLSESGDTTKIESY